MLFLSLSSLHDFPPLPRKFGTSPWLSLGEVRYVNRRIGLRGPVDSSESVADDFSGKDLRGDTKGLAPPVPSP